MTLNQTRPPTGDDATRLAPSTGWSLTPGYVLVAGGWEPVTNDTYTTEAEAKAAAGALNLERGVSPDNLDEYGNLQHWLEVFPTQAVLADTGGGRKVARLVPQHKADGLEKKFESLVKRATRLGIKAPAIYRVGEADVVKVVRDDDGRAKGWHWQRRVAYVVDSSPVFLDGWRIAGRIDHLSGDGGAAINMVALAPWVGREGLAVSPTYRSTRPVCGHCNTARKRNNTYLVEKDGDIKQVGRNCLRDYVGSETGAKLLLLASWDEALRSTLDEALDDSEGSAKQTWTTLPYLEFVAKIIQEDGWTSRGAVYDGLAQGPATADAAFSTMVTKVLDLKGADSIEPPTAADKARAEAARQWARDIDEDTDSDYLWNLRVACSMEVLVDKSQGVVASVFAAYDRAMGQQAEAKRQAKQAETSDYFGKKGDKIGRKLSAADKRKGALAHPALDVEVTFTRDIETDWGFSTLVKLADERGCVFSWFASNPSDSGGERVQVGSHYTLAATIKGHREYRDTKETQLTRCALTAK